ncbi:RNA polymerase, sigma 54 subunit, RpoN/SigL [Alkalithermobacter thermoalcaliphilus JW-YL-7 = DSM 7308]|uniref:RNA polymerase, sigma 54 subunit, RpoN n=2 Tax=Clostridium paradoxum TaxID=29346 RepID=A0A150FRL5_CLOPD|nr:RNA polymerase, sigma 54 subunit, RpoN [[Clostridium] paradoxum JW-YL-7 = DSM 7308]SHK40612.1 RNA polymerase, sigma 54 subunit, RpoN/SigL [[Clostridium] paradoxum JW-YL-7 = DSM 7308]
MEMRFNLDIRQTQKLVLTKQLKQSLEILTMTTSELEEKIIKENEENPVITVEKNENIDWLRYIQKNKKDIIQNEISETINLENMIKYQMTLYDYLKDQVRYINLDKKDKKIIHYIIDSIDEDGYLRVDIKDIQKDLRIDEKTLLKNLKVVQTLEPSGVGARNLKECLLIQLKELRNNEDIIENIIKEDLDLLAKKKYKDLCRKYKIKEEKLFDICKIIKNLEPKPGRKFSSYTNNYIQPDVIVEKVGSDLLVYINDKHIPTITINKFYEEILKNTKDENAKEYIKEKLNRAVTLIKNIENRKNTILKISEEIVNIQKEFFTKGKRYLKPMILKDIANKLNIHESTVSRAVNGKYILTPYGLFELKYFFSSGLNEAIASTSIKDMIKEIIDSENKQKPYSDQQIVDILKNKNINVSRRTVAKYREEMGILSSSRRKSL